MLGILVVWVFLIGQGTEVGSNFKTSVKVKFARNTEMVENVAIKVLTMATILKHKMINQVAFLEKKSQFSS